MKQYFGHPHCPHCGGLHFGQKFDDCTYVNIISNPNYASEQRHNAKEIILAHHREKLDLLSYVPVEGPGVPTKQPQKPKQKKRKV